MDFIQHPFLAQVAPDLVVIPVGYRNRFGRHKPDVVARYETLGSRDRRSDRDGAVMLKFSACALEAEGYSRAIPALLAEPLIAQCNQAHKPGANGEG